MKRKYKELSSEELKSVKNPEGFTLNVLLKSSKLYLRNWTKIKIINPRNLKIKKYGSDLYLVKSGVGYPLCNLYVNRRNAITDILKYLKTNKKAWKHNLNLYIKGLEQVTGQIKFFEKLLKMGA